MRNFATAPITSPINSVQMRCIRFSSSARMVAGRFISLFAGRQTSARGPTPEVSPLSGSGDDQLLADFDLVGIFQIIGFGNDGIFVGIAVEVLADLGQVVARLHGVILRPLAGLERRVSGRQKLGSTALIASQMRFLLASEMIRFYFIFFHPFVHYTFEHLYWYIIK